jgi:hypothetical protein
MCFSAQIRVSAMELKHAGQSLLPQHKMLWLFRGIKNGNIEVKTTMGIICDRSLINLDSDCTPTLSRRTISIVLPAAVLNQVKARTVLQLPIQTLLDEFFSETRVDMVDEATIKDGRTWWEWQEQMVSRLYWHSYMSLVSYYYYAPCHHLLAGWRVYTFLDASLLGLVSNIAETRTATSYHGFSYQLAGKSSILSAIASLLACLPARTPPPEAAAISTPTSDQLFDYLSTLPKYDRRLMDDLQQVATDDQIWKAFKSRRRLYVAIDGGL